MNRAGSKDPRNSPIGNLQIYCKFDLQSVYDTINDASANQQSVFDVGSQDNFDLLQDEIAFIQLDGPTPLSRTAAAPPVRTSLNGLGSSAKAYFPDDDDAQIHALTYCIQPLGTVWGDNIRASLPQGGMARPIDVAIQVVGQHTHMASVACGIGQILQYYVPSKKEISDPGRPVQRGVPAGKVRLGVRPIDPELVGKALMEETRRVIYNSKSWHAATAGTHCGCSYHD